MFRFSCICQIRDTVNRFTFLLDFVAIRTEKSHFASYYLVVSIFNFSAHVPLFTSILLFFTSVSRNLYLLTDKQLTLLLFNNIKIIQIYNYILFLIMQEF